MKLFTVTLAMAIFSRTWDSALSDEPVSKLAQLKQNVREYFADISRGIDEQVTMVRESNLTQGVIDYAAKIYATISRRVRNLEDELPSEVSNTFDLVVGIPTGVAEKAFSTFSEVTRRMKPATEELYDRLETVVSPYAKPAVDQVRTYADALRTGIKELNRSQKAKLEQQVERLETELGPYVKNVQNQLQEFQVTLQPLADEVQERLKQTVESITNSLKPYVGPVLEKIREHTRDFKKWVSTPLPH